MSQNSIRRTFKWGRFRAVSMLSLVIFLGAGSATTSAMDLAALRELPGIYVQTQIGGEVHSGILTANQLVMRVIKRLSSTGIKIYSIKEMREVTGVPIFHVELALHKSSDDVFLYDVDTYLDQQVTLTRMPVTKVQAITWRDGATGLVGADRLDELGAIIDTHVDRFIHDYRAVNPTSAEKNLSNE